MISTADPKYSKDLVCKEALNAWNKIKKKPKHEIENTIEYLIANAASTTEYLNPIEYFNTETSTQNRIIEKVIVPGALSPNAAAQNKAKEIIIKINDEIAKYQKNYNSTIYLEAKCELMDRIRDLKNRKKRPKFKEALASHKFRAANSKRRKEVIKVRMVNHLQEVLESKYDEHLFRTTVNNYLLPRYSNSIAAKKYHHLTNVQLSNVATILRNEKAEHQDNHYCLAFVKAVKQFASLFPIFSVIVLQDDKAKIFFGISAVSRTFQAIQSINKPVIISDYNFPVGSQQKLVSSVYLIIDPSDTNDMLRSGQLSIYICPQYKIGTSSITHMNDLHSLVNNGCFDNMLKVDNKIKPIWVLLVDGDIKKCNDIKYCSPKRYEKAASLLASNDGFFSPFVIGKDSHYINSIHLLEYLDKAKIPGYNQHCSPIADNYTKHSCPICEKYFPTVLMVAAHKKNQHLKEVCLTKRELERPKKTVTMAKKQKTK
ncbi:1209_t:CDS:2 [Cetraspora pellucida]|uniref:1209_t:CDS:1 n=1 Tax=Cetraspora pellucida TaxID=1433469 RepID=A0A9N8VXN7_9GLOM|nr:1209_t:CDS:2 [Cetraspora pellucida]